MLLDLVQSEIGNEPSLQTPERVILEYGFQEHLEDLLSSDTHTDVR